MLTSNASPTPAAANSAASSSTNAQAAATAATPNLAGNFNEFLQLLTTQLKHQDPTSPLDPNQFTQELVQFASVEQQINTNTSLNTLISLQQTEQAASALKFLGANVAVSGKTAQLANGQADWNYSVSQPATATINISNSTGQLVYSSSQTVQPGAHTFTWNGVDGQGTTWPSGPYTISIAAVGAGNQSVPVTTQVQGVVTGVDLSRSPPTLTIAGQSYPLNQITQVLSAGSSAGKLSAAGDRQAQAQRLYAQGVRLQQQGLLADAITAWRNALTLDSSQDDARYNLAVGLAASGDLVGAETSYAALLSRAPDHCKALYNLANLKMRQGDAAAAEPLYRRLLAADPGFTHGWTNLAMARSAQGDLTDAESCLRRALALEPGNVGAHWNLAHLLLTSRRWGEAWPEYEWRLRRPECPPPPVPAPEWTPADTQPRRILLWNDQGMGDALQFARYVPFLAARGHEVWLFVQDALKRLLESVPGVAGVVGASDPLPQVDRQAPLLSLPHRLGLADPAAAGRGAYIMTRCPMTLPRRPERRAVGLVWSSNPAHPNRILRDAPLELLRPLLEIDGIDWFGLQVGTAAQDIAAAGLADRVHDLSPQIHDFADTAAAVAALDLVITVDTSMPHLVGAMSKPGWVMISAAREWRWAGNEAESLWYPSLRLFRQQSAGDWSGVVGAIATALRCERGAAAKPAPATSPTGVLAISEN